MSGILRSIKTSCGWHSIAISTPSRPHRAVIVWKPWGSKSHSRSLRYSSLSSTIKIKAFLSMNANPPFVVCYSASNDVDFFCNRQIHLKGVGSLNRKPDGTPEKRSLRTLGKFRQAKASLQDRADHSPNRLDNVGD